MAPVGALLLISALDDDLLFSVSLLLLFAACPALSALARRAEVPHPPLPTYLLTTP
jgi:hypothetical protein